MSKKSSHKNFFKGADLRLNREIKKAREKAEGPKPGAKGFMKELNRREESRLAISKAKKETDETNLFRGETIATPKVTEELKLDKLNPADAEENEPNKGFSNQVNSRANWNGLK